VKLTSTLLPMAMLHELMRTNVTPVAVLLPPLNPDCRHADVGSMSEPFVGGLPSAADGATVIEPPLDRAAVAVKLTV
jgi:hypothetical protein